MSTDIRVKPYWGYQGQTQSNFGVYATFAELKVGEVVSRAADVQKRASALVGDACLHANAGEFSASMDAEVSVEPCGNGLARVYVVVRCLRGGGAEAYINGAISGAEAERRAERKAAKM